MSDYVYVKTDYVPASVNYLTVGKVYKGQSGGHGKSANITNDEGETNYILIDSPCAHLDNKKWIVTDEQEYIDQQEVKEIYTQITNAVKDAFNELGLEEFKKTSLFMSNRNKEDQLTIRDRFAITASERDIDNYIMWNSATCREEARYMFADAMLKERNK